MSARSVAAGIVLRGYLKASAIGANGFRRLAVSLGWQNDNDEVEHVEPYGHASRPLPGAEPFVVRVGASADQAVAILVADRRYLLQGLEEGEVALYDDRGSTVRLGRDGIHVSAAGVCNITSSGETTVDASNIRLKASSIYLGDGANLSLALFTDLKSQYDTHVHGGAGTAPTVPLETTARSSGVYAND